MKFELNPFARESVSKKFVKVRQDGMRLLERVSFEKGVVYDTDDYSEFKDFESAITNTVFKLLTSQVSAQQLKSKLGDQVKVEICKGCGGKVTGYTVPMFLEVKNE